MAVDALLTIKERRAHLGRRVRVSRPRAPTLMLLFRLLSDTQTLADYWRTRCLTAERRRRSA